MPKCVPQDPLLRVHGGSTLEAGDPGGTLPSTPLCDRPLTCESGAAGAATGAGPPAPSSVSPACLPGRLTPLPSFADASLLTRGCAPPVPLLSAAELLAVDSQLLSRPPSAFLLLVVLEIQVSHYTGQPLKWGASATAVPGGNPCRDGVLQVSCARSLPRGLRGPPVPPPLPLLPPGGCGLGLGCELMKEEGDSHVPWQG